MSYSLYSFIVLFLFSCLFLIVLGLHCCADFILVVVIGGYSLAMVHGLIVAASLVAERGLQDSWASAVVVLRLSS